MPVTTGSTFEDVRQIMVGVGASVKKNDKAVDIYSLKRKLAQPYLITKDPCEQARIYKEAYKSYNANHNEGDYDRGYYSFPTNNCGSWAKSILEASGKGWPSYFPVILNQGVGVGGDNMYTHAASGLYKVAWVLNQGYEAFGVLTTDTISVAAGTIISANRAADSINAAVSPTVRWVFVNLNY